MKIQWNEIGCFLSGVACTLIFFKDIIKDGLRRREEYKRYMEALIYGQSHIKEMYGKTGILMGMKK